MIHPERKDALMRLLEETGYCTVEYLSEKLFTSKSTVRRNLAQLEQLGLIRRSYGGAELIHTIDQIPLKLRYQKNHLQKDRIARKAVERIPDNAVIFIDASSTCLHMIPHIHQCKNPTIYTNSLEVCSLLAATQIPTYCLGGALLPKSLAFAGTSAIEMARSLYFDALFFSCSGYDGDVLSDYSEEETYLRRVLLTQAKKQYFLCDSTKIGKQFHYIICNRTEITEMISE